MIYGLALVIIHGIWGLGDYIKGNQGVDQRYIYSVKLQYEKDSTLVYTTHGERFLEGLINIFRGIVELIPVVGGGATFCYDSLKECWYDSQA